MTNLLLPILFGNDQIQSLHRHLINLACVILLISIPAFVGHARAATAYISDELTVPLRSGASGQHRILHNGLPSGTVLETIGVDEEAGFTQIRTSRGTEGWIRTQYLVSQPIAKIRLQRTQAELARLKQQMSNVRKENQALGRTNASQSNANAQGENRIKELEAELAEITRVSSNAVETHKQNLQLEQTVVRLRDELDDLAEARNRLEDNAENQAILIGAGLLLLGLLLGVIIKARPQKSAWS